MKSWLVERAWDEFWVLWTFKLPVFTFSLNWTAIHFYSLLEILCFSLSLFLKDFRLTLLLEQIVLAHDFKVLTIKRIFAAKKLRLSFGVQIEYVHSEAAHSKILFFRLLITLLSFIWAVQARLSSADVVAACEIDFSNLTFEEPLNWRCFEQGCCRVTGSRLFHNLGLFTNYQLFLEAITPCFWSILVFPASLLKGARSDCV